MKNKRKIFKIYLLKLVVLTKRFCKFISITTGLKFGFYGFYNSIISFTYIRAAEGLLHKSRGLSLFHAPFGFFMPLTEGFLPYFFTPNNDTK